MPATLFPQSPRNDAPVSEVRAAHASPDLINMAATVSFDLGGERADLVVKMSWVIMGEDGD